MVRDLMPGRDVMVSLRRASETGRSALNVPIVEWLELAAAWADVVPLSDQEREAAGEIGAAVVADFVIRSTAVTRALTADDIIRVPSGPFAGDWNIKGVLPHFKGRHRMMRVRAVIKTDKGA